MTVFSSNLKSLLNLTDDQFYDLCQANPEIKFERTPGGSLLIMAPTGGETGNRNSEVNAELVFWNRQTQLGKVFDSSTCFKLSEGGTDETSSESFRSPDLAWVRQDRWDTLTPDQKEKFPPIAPDFVMELMSPSDGLTESQAKMEEYRRSGVRLGWLIHRKQRQVWIYRPNAAPEKLENPITLFGEDVLPGFQIDMTLVW